MKLVKKQENKKNEIQKDNAENILDIIDYGIFGIIDTKIACQKLKLDIGEKNLNKILKELQDLKTNTLLENKKRGNKSE